MSTIAETRQTIATAVTATFDDVTCSPRPVAGNLRGGDAWVLVGQTAPYDFTESLTVFTVVIVLGSEQRTAEARIDELSIPVVDLLTKQLGGTDVSVEPQLIVAGQGVTAPLYALAATASLLVSA